MYNLTLVDTKQRSCDGCTVCCETLAIPQLQKPAWASCKHTSENGCEQYFSRPDSCISFSCLYNSGNMVSDDDTLRPDKLGVMFYSPDGSKVVAVEAWPGAAQTNRVKYIIEKFRKDRKVEILTYGT